MARVKSNDGEHWRTRGSIRAVMMVSQVRRRASPETRMRPSGAPPREAELKNTT